jgi:hypothetical protein
MGMILQTWVMQREILERDVESVAWKNKTKSKSQRQFFFWSFSRNGKRMQFGLPWRATQLQCTQVHDQINYVLLKRKSEGKAMLLALRLQA